jgi:hypothetical protein
LTCLELENSISECRIEAKFSVKPYTSNKVERASPATMDTVVGVGVLCGLGAAADGASVGSSFCGHRSNLGWLRVGSEEVECKSECARIETRSY